MKYRNDIAFFISEGKLKPLLDFPSDIAEKSDLAYEVIRVDRALPYFVLDHLNRLNFTLSQKQLANISIDQLLLQIYQIIEANQIEEGNLKIVVSFQQTLANPILYFIPHRYPSQQQYEGGVKTQLQYDTHKLPTAKFSDWKIRSAANRIIDTEDVYETVLVNEQGELTEGSRSNLFFIQGEQLFTAPNAMVLAGITRDKILEMAQQKQIKVNLVAVRSHEINEFDSCFLTGTSPGVLQIKKMNETNFKINHPIYRTLHKGYNLYSI